MHNAEAKNEKNRQSRLLVLCRQNPPSARIMPWGCVRASQEVNDRSGSWEPEGGIVGDSSPTAARAWEGKPQLSRNIIFFPSTGSLVQVCKITGRHKAMRRPKTSKVKVSSERKSLGVGWEQFSVVPGPLNGGGGGWGVAG